MVSPRPPPPPSSTPCADSRTHPCIGACVPSGDLLYSDRSTTDRHPVGAVRMVMCRPADPPLSVRATPRGSSACPPLGYIFPSSGFASPAAGPVVARRQRIDPTGDYPLCAGIVVSHSGFVRVIRTSARSIARAVWLGACGGRGHSVDPGAVMSRVDAASQVLREVRDGSVFEMQA